IFFDFQRTNFYITMPQPENPFVTINQFLSSIDKKIDELKKNQMEVNADADPSNLLTITEASKLMNLQKSATYSQTSKPLIPFGKRGKQLYFIKADLLDWLNKGKNDTQENTLDTPLEQFLRPLKK